MEGMIEGSGDIWNHHHNHDHSRHPKMEEIGYFFLFFYSSICGSDIELDLNLKYIYIYFFFYGHCIRKQGARM